MSLLQELLQIKDESILLERVDHMLDGLKLHFANRNNSDPGKAFSPEDIKTTAFQLAGLNFILDQKDEVSKKIDEFEDARLFQTFLNDIDEPRERKLFDNRTLTASEFLEKIGQKYDSNTGKRFSKILSAIKNHESLSSNCHEIIAFIVKLEVKLADRS